MDRAAYTAHLENQLDRLAAAALAVHSYGDRLDAVCEDQARYRYVNSSCFLQVIHKLLLHNRLCFLTMLASSTPEISYMT